MQIFHIVMWRIEEVIQVQEIGLGLGCFRQV